MSRVVYLSDARLPTEKAHGYQIMQMCDGMARLGHDVELVHPARRQPDPSLAEVSPFDYYGVSQAFRIRTLRNWDIVRLEDRLPTAAYRAVYGVHALAWGRYATTRVSRLRPNLVYTRDPALAFSASVRGLPTLYEAHLIPTARTRRLLIASARRRAVRAVLALTSRAAEEFESLGVPPSKVFVLPDGVDPAMFGSAPSREEARRLLGLPAASSIVGYVGSFQALGHEKGIEDLIRALATPELRSAHPLLVCVGGPMDRVDAYRRLAASLSIDPSEVRFVDRVPRSQVPTWLAAIDIGVMIYPSDPAAVNYTLATSPLKLFEYMAAGLPIVATDVPGLRDVLRDRENALLVPAGASPAQGQAIRALIDDPGFAARLGARAQRDAAAYTWERRAERALRMAGVHEGEPS